MHTQALFLSLFCDVTVCVCSLFALVLFLLHFLSRSPALFPSTHSPAHSLAKSRQKNSIPMTSAESKAVSREASDGREAKEDIDCVSRAKEDWSRVHEQELMEGVQRIK